MVRSCEKWLYTPGNRPAAYKPELLETLDRQLGYISPLAQGTVAISLSERWCNMSRSGGKQVESAETCV